MRRILILLFVATGLLADAASTLGQDLTDLARRSKESIVVLKVYSAAGREMGQGTGFFVDADRIVTNLHVVDRGARIDAVLADDRVLPVLGLWATDDRNDLAILAVDGGSNSRPLPLDTEPVEVGERIVVFGNPLGLSWTLSDGIVSAIWPDGPNGIEDHSGAPLTQITASISPGSSGSPVMNLRGGVLGVVVSYRTGGQNLNFAIPSTQVQSLLATLGDDSVPRSLGVAGTLASTVQNSFLRNIVISAIFFALLFVVLRRL